MPIDGNLLEKELIEQDVLSNAFQSIISSQIGEVDKVKGFQRSKPTSLALISSHTSKSVKHSNSCDILIKSHLKDECLNGILKNIEKKADIINGQSAKLDQDIELSKSSDCKSFKSCDPLLDKSADPTYSPDSLIADDPSSSSDYLSAAYTCSPGISSVFPQHLNVEISNTTKMENIFTSSDSGLENTGLLESLTSHKDITLTDMSLTESTLHDLTTDNGSSSRDSESSPIVEKKPSEINVDNSIHSAALSSSENNSLALDQPTRAKEMHCNSSKEEKQRQNEEIVILESSSLSSETGSWESVFPPKLAAKDACEKFIHNERKHFDEPKKMAKRSQCDDFTDINQSLVQKSPFKSTSCFIDAASLVDEEDQAIKIISDTNEVSEIVLSDAPIPMPSKPVPCSTNKVDISPSDWSENDNEDSLEQMDNKDPDSVHKDLSPTIFEMTPITEDSLCTNPFEPSQNKESEETILANKEDLSHFTSGKDDSITSSGVFMSNTPHNSIMSLKASSLKQYESEESESDTTIVGREGQNIRRCLKKYNESSPIISGGASVEDHLPNISSFSGSPLVRRKIENIPIVSGVYVPPPEEETHVNKSPRPPCAPAWVVDMSTFSKPEKENNNLNNAKKPCDKICDSLRTSSKTSLENCNKSRSSVDSDSSERSSHKFYIDFSSLPDPIPPKVQTESETVNEKKNMFSMYIDFGEKSTLKEVPHRLIAKKNNVGESKITPKHNKNKNECTPISVAVISEPNSNEIFEKYESLCEDPNISISEIISLNGKNTKDTTSGESKDTTLNKDIANEGKTNCERPSQRVSRATIHEESINATIAEESVPHHEEPFVKLSDLDKPVLKTDPSIIKKPERVGDERMTRSIPENNWCEKQNQGNTSRSNEIISSFHSENALSLNRLFPHLRNEFSRSMPGSLSSRTRSPLRLGVEQSPGDIDDQTSDTSDMSSVQSSFCRSIVGKCIIHTFIS